MDKEQTINMKNLCYIFILAISVLCHSCIDDNESEDWKEQKVVEVASEIVRVKVFGDPDMVDGIKVKNLNTKEWEAYPAGFIEGFSFEEGYSYTLSVEVIHLANPPMDGSNISCRLLEELTKVKDE